ncbi:hypothetical protein SLA2020_326420 [Shorea laevis]
METHCTSISMRPLLLTLSCTWLGTSETQFTLMVVFLKALWFWVLVPADDLMLALSSSLFFKTYNNETPGLSMEYALMGNFLADIGVINEFLITIVLY